MRFALAAALSGLLCGLAWFFAEFAAARQVRAEDFGLALGPGELLIIQVGQFIRNYWYLAMLLLCLCCFALAYGWPKDRRPETDEPTVRK